MASRNKFIFVLTLAALGIFSADAAWLMGPGKGSYATTSTYTASSAAFDGTSDRIRFTGSAVTFSSTKTFSCSFWVNVSSLSVARTIFLIRSGAAGPESRINISTGGAVSILFRDSAAATAFSASSTTTIGTGGWHHVLFSIDSTTGIVVFRLYLDGVNVAGVPATFVTDVLFALDRTDFYVGADSALGLSMNGCIAELWCDDTYIDFSNSANRLLFATSTGEPVDLGSTGATPTGAAPDLYMKFVSGSLGVNSGGDGGTGTLEGGVTNGTCGTVEY